MSDWDSRRCGHKSNWWREYLLVRISVFTVVVYKLFSPQLTMIPRMDPPSSIHNGDVNWVLQGLRTGELFPTAG